MSTRGRNLTKRQKKYIKTWFNSAYRGSGSIGIDDLPVEAFERLEAMHDHETIYQNINNYIQELCSKKLKLSLDKSVWTNYEN